MPRPARQNEVVTERILTTRELNRALLARQLLLERSPLSIVAAIEQVGGLQTQYAPSGYVGLWTRLAEFHRDALTEALVDRSVIQATLLRTTIHLVSRREYLALCDGHSPGAPDVGAFALDRTPPTSRRCVRPRTGSGPPSPTGRGP